MQGSWLWGTRALVCPCHHRAAEHELPLWAQSFLNESGKASAQKLPSPRVWVLLFPCEVSLQLLVIGVFCVPFWRWAIWKYCLSNQCHGYLYCWVCCCCSRSVPLYNFLHAPGKSPTWAFSSTGVQGRGVGGSRQSWPDWQYLERHHLGRAGRGLGKHRYEHENFLSSLRFEWF